MTIKDLKELLNQFADDEKVLIANYSEEDADGNMPCHEIEGVEYLPMMKGHKTPIAVYYNP